MGKQTDDTFKLTSIGRYVENNTYFLFELSRFCFGYERDEI